MQILDADDAKQEDEFVKDEIPQLVFHVLLLRDAQLSKDQLLYTFAKHNQAAVRHIDEGLYRKESIAAYYCCFASLSNKFLLLLLLQRLPLYLF